MLPEADELYGLPQDEFTPARDALAKRLRAEKRREEADAVKAMRRPSVAAWAINQAVRSHPEAASDLLAAGAELREAHEALLSGDADAAAVREAADAERDAVRTLARHAIAALGTRASDATADKIRATLHAASADDTVRDQVERGRLEREAEAGAAAWPLMGAGAEGGGPSTSPRSGGKRPGGKAAAKPARSGAKGTTKEARSAAKRGPSDAERRRAASADRARQAAERAEEARDEADAKAEHARSELAEAEGAAKEARAALEALEARERAARRAVKEAEAEAERRRTEARRALKEAADRA